MMRRGCFFEAERHGPADRLSRSAQLDAEQLVGLRDLPFVQPGMAIGAKATAS
jgi:hypothetical protein